MELTSFPTALPRTNTVAFLSFLHVNSRKNRGETIKIAPSIASKLSVDPPNKAVIYIRNGPKWYDKKKKSTTFATALVRIKMLHAATVRAPF